MIEREDVVLLPPQLVTESEETGIGKYHTLQCTVSVSFRLFMNNLIFVYQKLIELQSKEQGLLGNHE